jgi:hypothetical protein
MECGPPYHAARVSCSLEKSRLADLPFMPLAAHRAAGQNSIAADAKQRLKFAVDANVDVLVGDRADEMQPFHGDLRDLDGSEERISNVYWSSAAEIGIVQLAGFTVR